jgi:hypothetical protein
MGKLFGVIVYRSSKIRKPSTVANSGVLKGDLTELEYEIPAEGESAFSGVLLYFALLAYPLDLDSRNSFAAALHCWRCKNVKKDMPNWSLLPAEIREMPNRSIKGKMNMGLKRLEKRLQAGFIAHKIWIKDRPLPSFNPTTRNAKGLVVGKGIETVTEGLQEILHAEKRWRKEDINARSAIEDLRRVVWTDSLPVLHIATSLEFELSKSKPSMPMVAKIHRLLHGPAWLSNALAESERWFAQLSSADIPGFDGQQMIHLIPANKRI